MLIFNSSLYPLSFSFLALTMLICTFLVGSASTIVLRQLYTVQKAVSTQRSYYKKRAIQALELTFVLFSILFFASAIDIGFTHIFFNSLDYSVYNIIIYLPIFLSFSLFLARYWFRALKTSEENKMHWIWAISTSLTAIKAMGLMIISAYFTFYASPLVGPQVQVTIADNTSSLAPFIEFYTTTFKNIYMPIFANPVHCIYMLSFFCLASICLGYTFQIFYTLVCKSNDNFGRDYYNLAIKEYSKNAAIAILTLSLFVSLALFTNIIGIDLSAFNLSHSTILFFPLACALYFIIARSENPLRHKISICLCPMLIIISSVFFVLHTL